MALIPISEMEADSLLEEGCAVLFNCPCQCGCGMCGCVGFFEAKEGAKKDTILVITNDGYFVRAREDLVKSNDGVFVGFVEEGKPPEFEDVFEVREL